MLVDSLIKSLLMAGLWKSHLPRALLWHRKIDAKHRTVYPRCSSQRSERAPTWSWASLDGPIDPEPYYLDQFFKPLAMLVAAEVCEPSNIDSQYSIKGFVRLQTLVMKASYESSEANDLGTLSSEGAKLTQVRLIKDTPLETPSMLVYCALIGMCKRKHCLFHGRIHEPVDLQNEVFTRLGYLRFQRVFIGQDFGTRAESSEYLDFIDMFERKHITMQ